MSVFLTCFVWRNYNFVFPKLKVLMRLLWILVESLFNVQSFFQKNKWHITASCWMEGLGNINRTSSCLHNKWVDYSALRAIAIACLYTHNSSYNMSPIKFITVLIMLLKIKVQLSIPFLTMFVVYPLKYSASFPASNQSIVGQFCAGHSPLLHSSAPGWCRVLCRHSQWRSFSSYWNLWVSGMEHVL